MKPSQLAAGNMDCGEDEQCSVAMGANNEYLLWQLSDITVSRENVSFCLFLRRRCQIVCWVFLSVGATVSYSKLTFSSGSQQAASLKTRNSLAMIPQLQRAARPRNMTFHQLQHPNRTWCSPIFWADQVLLKCLFPVVISSFYNHSCS